MITPNPIERPKTYAVVSYLVLGAILFYAGIALWFVPVGYVSGIFAELMPLIFILPALLIASRLGWILRSERRSLWLTFPLCLGGVLVGGFLIFFARFHAYFLD